MTWGSVSVRPLVRAPFAQAPGVGTLIAAAPIGGNPVWGPHGRSAYRERILAMGMPSPAAPPPPSGGALPPGSGGDGDDDGGSRVRQPHPNILRAFDYAREMEATLLEGYAMSAIAEATGRPDADAAVVYKEFQTLISGLPAPEGLYIIVAGTVTEHCAVEVREPILRSYAQLPLADQRNVAVILQHWERAPVMVAALCESLTAMATYQESAWVRVENLMADFSDAFGDLTDLSQELFRCFVREATWEFRMELLEAISTTADAGLTTMMDAARMEFAQRIFLRLRDTSWPKDHPLWVGGASRYAKDPVMSGRILAVLSELPVPLLWRILQTDDALFVGATGNRTFTEAIWFVFEAVQGRVHQWPAYWMQPPPPTLSADDLRQKTVLRRQVERALEAPMRRMAEADRLFREYADDVRERVYQWVEEKPSRLRTLRRRGEFCITPLFDHMLQAIGEHRLRNVLEHDVLWSHFRDGAGVRDDPPRERMDPRGWTWLVASLFAHRKRLAAFPRMSPDDVVEEAERLYQEYLIQLELIGATIAAYNRGMEFPIPPHLIHTYYVLATRQLLREGAQPTLLHTWLQRLLAIVVGTEVIIHDGSLLRNLALGIGLNKSGAYQGQAVDPRDPTVLGVGMGIVANIAFSSFADFPQEFAVALTREDLVSVEARAKRLHSVLRSEIYAQVMRMVGLSRWLCFERPDSPARQAFHTQWNEFEGSEPKKLFSLMRGLLWINRIFGFHYSIALDMAEGIPSLRVTENTEERPSVTVTFRHADISTMLDQAAELIRLVREESRLRITVSDTSETLVALDDAPTVLLRFAPLPDAPPSRDLLPIARALVGDGMPHQASIVLMQEPGDGRRPQPLMIYRPPWAGSQAAVRLPTADAAALAAFATAFDQVLPAYHRWDWVLEAAVAEAIDLETIAGEPLLQSHTAWSLTDGDDRTFQWDGAALTHTAASAMAVIAESHRFDALVREVSASHSLPPLTPFERREALETFTELVREHPQVAHEYATRGWPLLMRRLVGGILLDVRMTPVFLARLGKELAGFEGAAADVRNFRSYMSTDRLVPLCGDSAALFAEMRTEWDDYVRRVRGTEAVLRTAQRDIPSAQSEDVDTVLEWYADQINVADTPAKEAAYHQAMPMLLQQAADRRRLREILAPELDFAPTQQAILHAYVECMLPNELAWIVAGRAHRTVLSRSRTTRRRIAAALFDSEQGQPLTLLQEAALGWKLFHEARPQLLMADDATRLRLRRDWGRVLPVNRATVIDLLQYHFVDAALEIAETALPETEPEATSGHTSLRDLH